MPDADPIPEPERPQQRFLPAMPSWLMPTTQRGLVTIGTAALLLPLVSVKGCGGTTRTLTGFEFYLSGPGNQAMLAFMLLTVAVVVARPWRLRRRVDRAGALLELSHASLLQVPVGIMVCFAVVAPMFWVFETSEPRLGYPIQAGVWVLLYALLGLTGMVRLSALLARLPRWPVWLVALAVPCAPPIRLVTIGEGHIEVYAIFTVITAIVGVPLLVALFASGQLARDGVDGWQHGLTVAVIVAWVGAVVWVG